MSATRPQLGLVGCGEVGRRNLDALLREDVDIAAICDPDSDALARMAARLPRRPKLFRTEEDLLAADLIDGVVLCTPHHLHERQIRSALRARVHVLCENPFALSPIVAEELVSLSRTVERALFVAFPLRSVGPALFLLDAVGRIGNLQRVSVTWCEPWLQRYQRNWRLRAAEGSGGFVRDAGADVLDLLLRLVDSPVVGGDALLERCGLEVDIRGSLRIEFRNGVYADTLLVGDSTESAEQIRLWGEHGTAGWSRRDGADADLYMRIPGAPEVKGDPALDRLSPITAFCTALRSGRGFGPDTAPDLFDAVSGLSLVSLLDRIYTAAVWK